MSGKKYFYALGQRARAWGWTKDAGMERFKIEAAQFDAGYRGLSL